MPPALAVVIVAYDSATQLPATLAALTPQLGPHDEFVVVDNACAQPSAAVVRSAASRAIVVEPGTNLGFAAGCQLGAQATRAPLLFFLNPDARPEPDCLEALRATAARAEWAAWQAVVLHPGGATINADGGVTHFLGFGWAGRCDEPVAALDAAPHEASFASGAALVVRRDAWNRLDGLDPSYFMYGEDLDLGLRLWLSGHRVGVVPAARVQHDYDFHKGARKWFLLERNRWRTVLADYPPALLLAVAPALVAFELALLPLAARGGWLRAKLRAQLAVLAELPALCRRRRRVQALRAIGSAQFAAQLTARLDSPYLAAATRVPLAVALQAGYWRAVRALLSALR